MNRLWSRREQTAGIPHCQRESHLVLSSTLNIAKHRWWENSTFQTGWGKTWMNINLNQFCCRWTSIIFHDTIPISATNLRNKGPCFHFTQMLWSILQTHPATFITRQQIPKSKSTSSTGHGLRITEERKKRGVGVGEAFFDYVARTSLIMTLDKRC